jgi:hypothetical protein
MVEQKLPNTFVSRELGWTLGALGGTTVKDLDFSNDHG